MSLLASCRGGKLRKHDSRSDWLSYRSLKYRDCTGSKMCNEDQCIFYINFGERNQKYFDKNSNCTHCAGSPQHIVTHVSKIRLFYLGHRS